jgi:hypothetical protein
MVVYDLLVSHTSDGRVVLSLEPMQGFEWKEGFRFWHEVLRREVKGVYFYEFLEPSTVQSASSTFNLGEVTTIFTIFLQLLLSRLKFFSTLFPFDKL